MIERVRSLGFASVLVLVIVGFSLAAPNFATVANALAILHAVVPTLIASCGIALVIFTGNIDISIGSIAFLSASVAGVLMEGHGLPTAVGLPLIVLLGASLGALNGLVVAFMRVNSLIATLGSMIAFRGLGLMLTGARVIPLPEQARGLGNLAVGGIPADALVACVLVFLLNAFHRGTASGRRMTAVGNSAETARRVGIDVPVTLFTTFVISGALAGLSAVASYVQVGSISGFLGKGLEFTAIAVAVVGGVSLAGGRGRILPGVAVGALTFQIIANGLNQVSANPYFYQLVTGIVIFVAMYMDALKTSGPGSRLMSLRKAG